MELNNTYQDARRAAAYDELELSGTYGLAFRALPELYGRWVPGPRALDFGCGTGRSTRFLKALGFSAMGIDVSPEMVGFARRRDPDGDYLLIGDGDFSALPPGGFDLVQSAFTFDNISGLERRARMFRGLGGLLAAGGVLANIVSTPEIYTHEWGTVSTAGFPENRAAARGDVVRIVTTEYSDARPVEDVLWPHEDYLELFDRAGLEVAHVARPLARGDEGIAWKSETRVAPWAIYLLRRQG